MHTQRGFTLVELLVTLSIIGMLTFYAIPSLYHFYANNKLWLYTQKFTQTLTLARSEAIKRNSEVLICPIEHTKQCASGNNWNKRWMIFVDNNKNRKWEKEEPVLRRTHFDDSPISIRSTRKSRIIYFSNGKSAGSNASFIFCDGRGADYAKAVILSNSGRFRVTDKKSDGEKLSC